jgi:hypothetical protein
MSEDNGWIEYKKLILAELTRSNDRLSRIEADLSSIKEELAVLRTKMYFGSAIIAVFISIGVTFVNHVIKG